MTRMVVVTTDSQRRGVFFGELLSFDANVAVLANAQMAIYWSAESRGVLGLASIGPQPGSRITPIVPRVELNGVTAIIDCTPAAVELWRTQTWS